MTRPTYSAILAHAARTGKPALVFVPSRKHARMVALDLLTSAAADGEPARFRCVVQIPGVPNPGAVGVGSQLVCFTVSSAGFRCRVSLISTGAQGGQAAEFVWFLL